MTPKPSYPRIPYLPPTVTVNPTIRANVRRPSDGNRLFTVKEHMKICQIIKKLYPNGLVVDSAQAERDFVESVAATVPFFLNISPDDLYVYFEALGYAVPSAEDRKTPPPTTPVESQTDFVIKRVHMEDFQSRDYDVIERSRKPPHTDSSGSSSDSEDPRDPSMPRLGVATIHVNNLRRPPSIDIPKRVAATLRMLKSKDHADYIETLFRVYEMMRSRKLPPRIETQEVHELYQRAHSDPRIQTTATESSGPSYESLIPIIASQLNPSLPRPVSLFPEDLLFQTILQAVVHVEEYRTNLFVRLCYRKINQAHRTVSNACRFCDAQFPIGEIKTHALDNHRDILSMFEDFLIHKDKLLENPAARLGEIVDLITQIFAGEKNDRIRQVVLDYENGLFNNQPMKYFTFWSVPTAVSRDSYARLFKDPDVIRGSSTSSSDSSSSGTSSSDESTSSSDESTSNSESDSDTSNS